MLPLKLEKWKWESSPSVTSHSATPGWWSTRLLCPFNCLGKKPGVGSHSLLQGFPQPRDKAQVSCISGTFFTVWATRKTYLKINAVYICINVYMWGISITYRRSTHVSSHSITTSIESTIYNNIDIYCLFLNFIETLFTICTLLWWVSFSEHTDSEIYPEK